MSWYDPSSWNWGRIGAAGATGGLSELGGARTLFDAAGTDIFADPGADQERQRKALLYGQAQAAGGFADTAQQGYGQLGNEAAAQRGFLQALASGQNSISAEQLRQGLQQNLAAQQSMAASASPMNAAMAARTAAIQSARLGAGLSGQQALAGLQERQMAQQALANMILQQRGQDLQAALGSRGNALQGYGAANAGAPEKSWIEKYGPAITGALGTAASFSKGGAAASDRRLKTDIKDGDDEANEAAAKLPRAWVFKYKDQRFGEGKQLGTMAQDLERAGLGHTVMDTPGGKVVHGAKLATANTAMIAAMSRRLERLEGKDE